MVSMSGMWRATCRSVSRDCEGLWRLPPPKKFEGFPSVARRLLPLFENQTPARFFHHPPQVRISSRVLAAQNSLPHTSTSSFSFLEFPSQRSRMNDAHAGFPESSTSFGLVVRLGCYPGEKQIWINTSERSAPMKFPQGISDVMCLA